MSGPIGGSAGAVVRQGHLRKLKTMKKKFFVLRAETAESSARLEYYESEKKCRTGASPRRVLPLKSCYNIMRRLDLKQKHVIALFTREEQFCIVAENEQELHAWLSAILKQHRSDEASDELLHPIQHVWQVNVQKKGLGATKNIQGLYNLCLTDKTLTLVKIKSHNNVISDLGIPERVEYSLKNIRRCGDSECFFYMEVGRQTATGAGELWMHTDDCNIAQSMHSTIYHAMRNCAKETENERDHIVLPKGSEGSAAHTGRRQSYSPDGKGRLAADVASTLVRNRCDSMPSRACSTFEMERPSPRYSDMDGLEVSRDEADAADWYRTPRIPEEPDCVDISKDFINASLVGLGSIQHSRTSSVGETCEVPSGYLPMAPGHDPLGGLISASSGSVCSGTPSTDPRFSEYQLEPAMSHFGTETRPPRANSVGSRPTTAAAAAEGRHRAYSVGARAPPRGPRHAHSRHSTDDHMEIDFSNNSPATRVPIARTPPTASYLEGRPSYVEGRPKTVDEYVDMSPRNAGYVVMRPGESLPRPPVPAASTPDGYVPMNYGKPATRPIAIGMVRPAPPMASSPDDCRRLPRESRTPLGSQTLFPFSPDSPASPPEMEAAEPDEPAAHPLSTVREISEDGRRSPEASSSPQYVTLAKTAFASRPIAAPIKSPIPLDDLPCNPTATKTIARVADPVDTRVAAETSSARLVLAGGGAPARFSVGERSPPAPSGPPPLNYAALDLEPPRATAAPAQRAYTQIDFIRSEKLHAADAT